MSLPAACHEMPEDCLFEVRMRECFESLELSWMQAHTSLQSPALRAQENIEFRLQAALAREARERIDSDFVQVRVTSLGSNAGWPEA